MQAADERQNPQDFRCSHSCGEEMELDNWRLLFVEGPTSHAFTAACYALLCLEMFVPTLARESIGNHDSIRHCERTAQEGRRARLGRFDARYGGSGLVLPGWVVAAPDFLIVTLPSADAAA